MNSDFVQFSGESEQYFNKFENLYLITSNILHSSMKTLKSHYKLFWKVKYIYRGLKMPYIFLTKYIFDPVV